jgi:hypothetical protein
MTSATDQTEVKLENKTSLRSYGYGMCDHMWQGLNVCDKVQKVLHIKCYEKTNHPNTMIATDHTDLILTFYMRSGDSIFEKLYLELFQTHCKFQL